jgi:protoporphyrinogen oxidase
MKQVEVLIIGGGIGGLYTACGLKKQGRLFHLVEANQVLGGFIQQQSYQGFVIPQGPRIFLRSRCQKLLDLATEYGAPFREILDPLPRYLLSKEGLLKPLSKTIIFKYPQLLNLILKKRCQDEQSIGEFFSTVVGRRFVDEVIDPLCSGIWAQDPYDLSMDHLMGSIKKKQFFLSKTKGLVVFPQGLHTLLSSMGCHLKEHMSLNTQALCLKPEVDGVVVTTTQGEFKAKRVVLATSFNAARSLLQGSGLYESSLLFKQASVDVVSFFFSKRQKRPFGSGYLLAKKWGYLTKGVLFDADFLSYKGCDLMSCFIQNSEHPVEDAYRELKKVLGALDLPEQTFFSRYQQAIFSCGKGDAEKLKQVKLELAQKHIFLLGAYPQVGVADVIASACKLCVNDLNLVSSLDPLLNLTIPS